MSISAFVPAGAWAPASSTFTGSASALACRPPTPAPHRRPRRAVVTAAAEPLYNAKPTYGPAYSEAGLSIVDIGDDDEDDADLSSAPAPQAARSAPQPDVAAQALKPTTNNPDWMFFDVARVLVKGGMGGDGCLAFRREKSMPRGGPAGGTGGSGGSIIFTAEPGANTLAKFRGGAAFRGRDGQRGDGKDKTGECARDVSVPVPVGTVVRDEAGKVLADLTDPGQSFVAARGGRGGRGNAAFKTDKNRAPKLCENGEPGLERWLRLELKLVADVALVGAPNAGKSTILDAVSNARPKIADYPFTTIVPNLGVVDGEFGPEGGLVLADVPGLIEGAHKGVGMGVSFLRHVERCKVVVHVLDGTEEGVVERYLAIRKEMELFDKLLARKKEVVLLNKMDLDGVLEAWEGGVKEDLVQAVGVHKRIAIVSAKRRMGLDDVMKRLRKLVDSVEADDNVVVLGDEDDVEPVIVEKLGATSYRLSGARVERAYRMTNFDQMEGIERFQRILEGVGANTALIEAGAKDGDSIECFEHCFDYYKKENTYAGKVHASFHALFLYLYSFSLTFMIASSCAFLFHSPRLRRRIH